MRSENRITFSAACPLSRVRRQLGASLGLAGFLTLTAVQAQTNLIGVGVPTGNTRNDTYPGAGFEFYAPPGGTTINALGFWDASGTGLQMPHTIAVFQYDSAFDPSGYSTVVTATVPPGTNAPLIDGYRWVGIPTTVLPNNGQGGGYYAILAVQSVDTWSDTIGTAPYLDPAIGTVSGQGLLDNGRSYTILSDPLILSGTGDPNQGYGGPNLAYLTNAIPASAAPPQFLWESTGTFTNDSVLALVGAVSNEVYGVDFGGSGPETTTNGFSFDDYQTTGNVTVGGGSDFNAYLSGGGTTGDSNFDTILNYGVYGGGGFGLYAVLNNLTVGQRYNVLALEADTRGSSGVQFQMSDYLTLSPAQTFTFPGGTPAIGGYILGSFTAAATSQIFTMYSPHSQYNAILLAKAQPVLIQLVTNTTPSTASVGSGGSVSFLAAFSNSPAVTLQWQFVGNGVTNVISSGVVTATNNGVIGSTLTLTNVNLSNAGLYRLEAISVQDSAEVAFSSSASLTVIPVITWYPAGTYNGTFTNDSVLALAGPVANEVYGVDFGGSGAQTTANGYTFDDYATSGNMSVAGNISYYNSYLTGGATTGDPALDAMLTDGAYGETDMTGTLNNLTVGQAYTVLVLLDDTRGAAAGGSVFHVTDGVTVSPGQGYAFANGQPAVGGYIMGTFTAQATTQPLSVFNVLGAASQYNLILVEKGIAPPPNIPPSLTTNVTPLLSEVPAGAPMTFRVAASGATPLVCQWSDQNGAIAGATNFSFSFNASSGTNAYYVTVTNAAGAAVSATAVVVGDTAPPPVVTFSNADWTLNDNGAVVPTLTNDVLMLTDGNFGEASSAFYGLGQYAGGFVASFYYQASGGADGTTFCLQNSPAGTNALGGAGGGLGFAGLAPSAAFEMNINPTPIHGGVGILVATNGSIGNFNNSGYLSTAPVNLASGDNIYVRLFYLDGVMQVLLIDPTASATNALAFPVDLPGAVGGSSAYVGFTGGDGATASVQSVSNFLYSYTTPPVLAIAQGGAGQVIVSWPVSVASWFTLEQSGTPAGPWSPAAPVSTVVNGLQNQAALGAANVAMFYRLQLHDPNAP